MEKKSYFRRCLHFKAFFFMVIAMSSFTLSACAQPKKASQRATTQSVLTTDSALAKVMGDSICEVVFNATTAKCFGLSTDKAGDNDKRIGGYKVTKEYGKVSKENLRIIQYLLSDSKNYMTGINMPTVPFLPEVALEFTAKKNTIDLVFSFAGGEMAIVYNGNVKKTVKYTNERTIMLFFQRMLNNKAWAEILEVKYN